MGWSGLFYPPNGLNFQFCRFNLIFLIAPNWSESSFILFYFILLYFIFLFDPSWSGPSRSELIRPGLAVRVDPVRLLYLPIFLGNLRCFSSASFSKLPLQSLWITHARLCKVTKLGFSFIWTPSKTSRTWFSALFIPCDIYLQVDQGINKLSAQRLSFNKWARFPRRSNGHFVWSAELFKFRKHHEPSPRCILWKRRYPCNSGIVCVFLGLHYSDCVLSMASLP